MKDLFDVKNFNLIQDDENYYFFRSLEPGDIEDIENNIITKENGFIKLRTDRERWEETHEEKPKYSKDSSVSLEEMFNHIKMHYSLQTNCISLSSNANVARTYGETFSDRYVMIKAPKKEMGEKVFHAGEYMLDEIEKQVENAISTMELSDQIKEDLKRIDEAKNSREIKEIIQVKYSSEKLDLSKKGMRKGIVYCSPHYRVSNFQALNSEQSLEKNKIIGKLTVLERKGNMKPLMRGTANNNFLIQTLGSAFSSSEQIYYGDIDGERITEISKEALDIFGLLQQLEKEDKTVTEELKRELLKCVVDGKFPEISEESNLRKEYKINDNITIDEMYELTEGRVEYGKTNSIVKNIFYLAKGQSNARKLAEMLRDVTKYNPKYERTIEYIENNCFEIEPKIITRKSNKGYRISESVNLNLKQDEYELVNQIKSLSNEEQEEILKNGGLSNVRNIMTSNFSKVQSQEKIDKETYYAEAIFSLYDWNEIGIKEFKVEERNNFLKRLKENHCLELYKKIEEQGIERKDIPKILLNTITRSRDFKITDEDTLDTIKQKRLEQYDNILNEKNEELNQELSIERVERFLGYYDVEKTQIQLRQYQERAVEKTDEIFENNRFASVILPTGGGKSFVTIAELMKHKDEEIVYLAPQIEIIEQMKDYIIEYVHGRVNTVGRYNDEIIAEIFPNLKFSTYAGLKERKEIVNKQYGFIVLDELHRTGANEWGKSLDKLLEIQNEDVRVLGITATPRRDMDGKDMSIEIAEKLGYTNRDAVAGKHVAINMSLVNAIRMGLVVNPKLVSCVYNLSQDGSLDRLKEKIEDINDIFKKNEELEKYEELRRNVEKADGVEKILQNNVKKGGKYIVFLPVIDNFEDEDGNSIGNKKGKEKIEEYEKQIREYFKGSDIVPNFHSLLGEYGDKENSKRLEEFKNKDSEDTEFMLVINKANEGLHLSGLDGIIWLRPLDENSRILYLQQLGRAIYSEDPDNRTKDEDRPVIIDIVNNTLKVDWQNIVTKQDDIELLNIVIDWVEKHNGVFPNINSNDMEQIGYATCLKEIQKKYSKYLDENYEDLNEKQIEEVKEIIELGSSIDLWQTEIEKKKRERSHNNDYGEKDNEIGKFELNEILRDFVELKKEVYYSEKSFTKLLRVCESLDNKGFSFENIKWNKVIERNGKTTCTGITIRDIIEKNSELNLEEVLEEIGIDENYPIGSKRNDLEQNLKGRGEYSPPTEEEINKFDKLGVININEILNGKENLLLKVCDALFNKGFSFNGFQRTKTIEENGEKNSVGKTIRDIIEENPNLNLEEVLEEIEIDENYPIGSRIKYIEGTIKGTLRGKMPTEEEINKFDKLGVIDLNEILNGKENILLKVCDALINKGFSFKGFKKSKTIKENGKEARRSTTIRDIIEENPELNLEEVLEEIGIDENYTIGRSILNLEGTIRGTHRGKMPTKEEINKFAELGVIDVNEILNGKENILLKVCDALVNKGFSFKGFKKSKTIKENGKEARRSTTIRDIIEENPELNLEEVLEEIGIDENYTIGRSILNLEGTIRGTHRGKMPTKEEINKFAELGVIDIKKLLKEKEKKLLNVQENELEELLRLCDALAKRGFSFKGFQKSKTIKKKGKKVQVRKTLRDIIEENPNLNLEEVLEEIGIDENYTISRRISSLEDIIKGTKKGEIPTEEEMNKFDKLGVIDLNELLNGKENLLLKVCDALFNKGFSFKGFNKTKTIKENGKKSQLSTTIRDIIEENPELNLEEVLKEGIDENYQIGSKISNLEGTIKGTYRGKMPTEDEMNKFIELGVIDLNELLNGKENLLLKVCDALFNKGFSFNGFQRTKTIEENGKKICVGKTIRDIIEENPNLNLEEVLEEIEIDENYPIGSRIQNLQGIIKGTNKGKMPTEEEINKFTKLGVIDLEKLNKSKKVTAQEIGQAGFGVDTKVCDEVADAFNKELSKQKTGRDIN